MAPARRQTRSRRAGRWRDLGAEGRKRFCARGAAQRLCDRGAGERPPGLAMRRQDRLPAGPDAPRQGKTPPCAAPSDAAEAAARAAASPIVDEGLRDAVTRLGARAIDRSARQRVRRTRKAQRELRLVSRHSLAGREILRMNGAGNAILVLDMRGSPGRPGGGRTGDPSRAWPQLRSDDGHRRSDDGGRCGGRVDL